MEGYNPNASCTLTSCGSTRRHWVPAPPVLYSRRNALIDAHAVTEDPCHPPGRCYPSTKPVPKFRMLRELDACDINNFKQEQKAAKRRECLEQWNRYYESLLPQPSVEVTMLDGSRQVAFETDPPYRGRLREAKIRTNLIAGFFNPDDNKSAQQLYAERCDPAFMRCGPDLPEYPCRGIINFPRLRWVSKEEEERTCFPADCKDGPCSYLTPEYLYEFKRKKERWAEEDRRRMLDEDKREEDSHNQYLDSYGGPCTAGRCSETRRCYHPNKA